MIIMEEVAVAVIITVVMAEEGRHHLEGWMNMKREIIEQRLKIRRSNPKMLE